MKYFVNVTSYENLKKQFYALAQQHHPDAGGSTEAMQAVNNEYDQLFAVWKAREDVETRETAESTRNEFYTQNGWKGENYDIGRSLKDIATLTRDFMKNNYPDFRFSVRTSYASLCQELHINMTESPVNPYKTPEEWTEEEQAEARQLRGRWEYENDKPEVIENRLAKRFLSPRVAEAKAAVDAFVNSYNYSDCDGQIDYFNVNFYYFGCEVGRYDKECKVVTRDVPKPDGYVWETYTEKVKVKKKRNTTREIASPATFAVGQRFKLKGTGWRYGCHGGMVYEITRAENGLITAYWLGRQLKKVCTGDVRGNRFGTSLEFFTQYVEQGAIAFVEVYQETYTEEVERQQRRKVYANGAAVSTETREPTEAEKAAQATQGTAGAGKEYTIRPDTHTKTGAALWVVNFAQRMDNEEYRETAAALGTIKGRWNRFKKGFVFYYDPADALATLFGSATERTEDAQGNAEPKAKAQAEAPPTDAEMALADWLEDTSTEVIKRLRLASQEYKISQKYRRELEKEIEPKRQELTPRVLACLTIPDFAAIVRDCLARLEAISQPPVNADGTYNMAVLKAYTREEYCTWYLREFARLHPGAQLGVDYSINDAEFYYTEFHKDDQGAA